MGTKSRVEKARRYLVAARAIDYPMMPPIYYLTAMLNKRAIAIRKCEMALDKCIKIIDNTEW